MSDENIFGNGDWIIRCDFPRPEIDIEISELDIFLVEWPIMYQPIIKWPTVDERPISNTVSFGYRFACDVSEEEAAERSRRKSRQERRQEDRLKRKGRS